jgi:ankyrin repeat protein
LSHLAKTNVIAAIKLGDEARVAALLGSDQSLASRLTSDLMPLHQAIRSKQSGIARLLLERGASMDAKEASGGPTTRELAEKAGMLSDLAIP